MNDECIKPIDVLLIEDNPADVDMMREVLKEQKFFCNLHVAKDGEQAMDFLRHQGEFTNAPVPDLILLDLNLPRKDGREVMAEIKGDPELSQIPVVVVTSSEAETDILLSFDMNVNCYVCKPVDIDQFMYIVNVIDSFWLTVVNMSQESDK